MRIGASTILALTLLLGSAPQHTFAQAAETWNIELAQGRWGTSEIVARNKCLSSHRFQLTKSEDLDWLTFIDEPSVTIASGQSKPVKVRIDTADMDAGIHKGRITFTCVDCAREPGCRPEILPVRFKVTWASAEAQELRENQVITQQILVLLDQAPSGEIENTIRQLEATYQLRRIRVAELGSISRVLVLFSIAGAPQTIALTVISVQSDPRVVLAQPNYVYATQGARQTNIEALQYGLKKIRADVAQTLSTGKGVKVAVLDSGVDSDHPCLKGRVIDKKSFVDGDEDFRDVHGTLVAGIIAANPARGLRGVAPDAKIMALKVCKPRSNNSIEADGTSQTIAQGLDYAILRQANVINLSLGGPRDPLINQLVKEAYARGIAIVAAAGNGGPTARPLYPAALAKVIAVSAIDMNDQLYPSAARGEYVDLVAPGVEVFSALPGNKFSPFTGTSMAAPHVTGVIALILQKSPAVSPAEMSALLEKAARDLGSPGKDDLFGSGCVDACKSLEALTGTVLCR